MVNRISEAVKRDGELSQKQFGFQKGYLLSLKKENNKLMDHIKRMKVEWAVAIDRTIA